MESFFIRYRNLLVLLALLVAQMIGLAVQVRRSESGRNGYDTGDGKGVRLIRLWANALVSPAEWAMHSTKLGTENLWQDYIDLRRAREENKQLQQTIDRLRLEQASLLEDAAQGHRLQSLLGFQQKYIYKTVAAQAIGSSGTDLSRVFYLDKGAADGLQRDMAVITPDGIVGKVRDVFPHSAQVLGINDPTSGAGVLLSTTRIRGILRGNADGKPQIVGILADNRIQPGEVVVTAGGDQIFPRGLPVGVVEKVMRDPERDAFIDVIVKPAAHLDRLDEVLVITSTEPRFSAEQQQDLADSQTLKGAEAAAIEEQKKAADSMAGRLPELIDPKLPPEQQPLKDSTPPMFVPRPIPPKHPDRFTPGSAVDAAQDTDGGSKAAAQQADPAEAPKTAEPAATTPRRNQ